MVLLRAPPHRLGGKLYAASAAGNHHVPPLIFFMSLLLNLWFFCSLYIWRWNPQLLGVTKFFPLITPDTAAATPPPRHFDFYSPGSFSFVAATSTPLHKPTLVPQLDECLVNPSAARFLLSVDSHNSGWFDIITTDASAGAYILYAALHHPKGSRYGCFLRPRSPIDPKAYSCPGLDALQTGDWQVEIMLYRYQCQLESGIPRGLLEFMDSKNITTFTALRAFFDYPFAKVLDFVWQKKTRPAQNDNELLTKRPLQNCKLTQSDYLEGRWVRFKDACEKQPRWPFCQGIVQSPFANTSIDVERDMNHMFVPFNCSYKYYDAEAAMQCLRKKRLILVGDSRMRQLRAHINHWLRNDTVASM